MDRIIAVAVFWAIVALFPATGHSQQTRQEIYELDIFTAKRLGSSEATISQYFVMLGLDELRELRDQEHLLGSLDEQSLARREALNEVLTPLHAIDILYGTPAYNSEIAKERMRLLSSSALSESVFSTIGAQRMRERVLNNVAESLRSISSSKKENAFFSNAPLLNPTLGLVLDLTDDQSSELKALYASATETARFGSIDAFKKMERLLESHWSALRASLESEQRKLAEDLVGEPLQWFRGLPSCRLRNRDFSGGVFRAGTKAMELQNSTQRNLQLLSEEEMYNGGVQMIHGHFYEMLKSTFIMGEIELVEDQRKEMESELSEYLKTETCVVPNRHEKRLSQILESEADYPDAFKDIFTSLQLDSLKDIEFQVLTGKFESSLGLLHPVVTEHLKIDSRQIKKIRELAEGYEAAYSELVPEINLARAAVFDSLKNDMFRILNVDQQKRYRAIFPNEEGLTVPSLRSSD